MRTTVRIDDDVLRAAKALAMQRRETIGEVLSSLARKGLKPSVEARYENDFPVFDVREESPVFGPDEVREALDDE